MTSSSSNNFQSNYINKSRAKDEIEGSKRYKTKFVVEGFQKKDMVDYNEIFSLVVKITTINTVYKAQLEGF